MISHRQDQSERRRKDDRDERLVEAGPLDPAEAGMCHPGPDNPADQGMARRRGDALEPGHDVPEHRADQRAEDHRRGHQVLVDQALADRLGDLVQCGQASARK